MKALAIKCVAVLALVALCVQLTGRSADAQKRDGKVRRVFLEMQADFTPIAATGLLMKSTGLMEVPAAFTADSSGVLQISFELPESAIAKSSYVSAMAASDDGLYAYSNVQLLGSLEASRSLAAVPPCAPKEPSPALNAYIGQLTSIVNVRTDRRKNRAAALETELSDKLMDKLQRYEEAFGLQQGTKLSADLNPLELTYRLERILNTWDNFNKARQGE